MNTLNPQTLMNHRHCTFEEAVRIVREYEAAALFAKVRNVDHGSAAHTLSIYRATLAEAFPKLSEAQVHDFALYVGFTYKEWDHIWAKSHETWAQLCRWDGVELREPDIELPVRPAMPKVLVDDSRADVIRELLESGAGPEFVAYAARTSNERWLHCGQHHRAGSEPWAVPMDSPRHPEALPMLGSPSTVEEAETWRAMTINARLALGKPVDDLLACTDAAAFMDEVTETGSRLEYLHKLEAPASHPAAYIPVSRRHSRYGSEQWVLTDGRFRDAFVTIDPRRIVEAGDDWLLYVPLNGKVRVADAGLTHHVHPSELAGEPEVPTSRFHPGRRTQMLYVDQSEVAESRLYLVGFPGAYIDIRPEWVSNSRIAGQVRIALDSGSGFKVKCVDEDQLTALTKHVWSLMGRSEEDALGYLRMYGAVEVGARFLMLDRGLV